MIDPRLAPHELLRIARLFELNGDRVSAVVAYREVVLAGEPCTAAAARLCLATLARDALPQARRSSGSERVRRRV